MTGPSPRALAVVVPARDEAAALGDCLAAVDVARRAVPQEIQAVVVVVAHRCTDATAAIARDRLGPDAVVVDEASPHVAAARSAGVRRARALLGRTPPPGGLPSLVADTEVWLANTDADSLVPPDWLVSILHRADQGAAAVVGTTRLLAPPGEPLPPALAALYDRIVADGVEVDEHRHVYGANLAVRLDAYLAVGGFPAVTPGEDAAIVAALDAAGWPVARPLQPVVATSGRLQGRARGGLADLLADLARWEGGAEAAPDVRARPAVTG